MSESGNQTALALNIPKISIKRRSGISIPTEYRNTAFYCLIRAHLTRKAKNYQDDGVIINKFFLESEKYLTIPRFFPLEDYIQGYEFEDNSHSGKDILINHNIKARDEIQQEAMDFMLQNDKGIIQLNPGVGKTVISIHTVSERKKKTFILVHKDYLADQWIGPGKHGKPAGFLDFTDINPDEVIRLTSDNYLDALGKSIIVTTDQTFISLLKRQRKPFLEALNKANIGILIGDEVHTSVGAPTFSECSIHIPAKVVFGLSATPYRYDGNADIIEYHMGKIFTINSSSGEMQCKVTVFLMDFEILNGTAIKKGKEVEINRFAYLYWEGKFQRSRYLNILKNSKPFMNLCQSLLIKFSGKRDLLFIGERIDKLLKPLFDWLKSDDKGLFISGSTDKDLQHKDVFSTPGKIRDGVDVPNKDLLIMTSPISNIAQICGRVTRIKDGKQTPIIIDMVDIGLEDIAKSIFGRLDYYDSKEWPVQFILVKDGKTTIVERNQAIKIISEEK